MTHSRPEALHRSHGVESTPSTVGLAKWSVQESEPGRNRRRKAVILVQHGRWEGMGMDVLLILSAHVLTLTP